ncbi:GntR family transcriptional regulator [Paenibacillus alba]|uniref:GntR family transcriptional regulator n=1 Tax=Paenibacillus alba TaxID=1197127 RepID=UPI001564D19B|nr:GntR family transcriptional regulator [Paenibacillus alba]NQX71928.1 GntR family transcriptional regulator [Paenibacillus alba]
MAGKPKRSTFRTRLEDMVTSLQHDIVNGNLKPGDYSASELVLAEQFQLSKNSIRKGLNVLLNQKMIGKVPRIDTRIAVQMIPFSNSYFSQDLAVALEWDGLDLITLNTQNYESVTKTGTAGNVFVGQAFSVHDVSGDNPDRSFLFRYECYFSGARGYAANV